MANATREDKPFPLHGQHTSNVGGTVRQAARVILIDTDDRVLFLDAHESTTGATFWVMPGGGLLEGESFEAAAAREAHEETGFNVEVGPCVWWRYHEYTWHGKPLAQFERFFFARVSGRALKLLGGKQDSYVRGVRWWSVEEMHASSEVFTPRRAAEMLPAIIRGDLPDEPFDCGV